MTDEEAGLDDLDVVRRIGVLADEEHALERPHTGKAVSDDELARLKAAEVALDQCWDLLRQRRARRNAGEDPADAASRPARVVEGNQQ